MAYLSDTELAERFDQAELDELFMGLSQAAKQKKLSAAIDDAEAVANAYLSKRYRVPVAAGSLIKRVVADIARFHLFENLASAEVRERYDDQIKFLKDVAANRADLSGASEESEAIAGGAAGGVLVGGGAEPIDMEGY